MDMGVITFSMDDEVEEDLRDKIDDSKGALGEAITKSVKNWIKKEKSANAKENLKNMIEEGFDMGEIQYEHRSELHERTESSH